MKASSVVVLDEEDSELARTFTEAIVENFGCLQHTACSEKMRRHVMGRMLGAMVVARMKGREQGFAEAKAAQSVLNSIAKTP